MSTNLASNLISLFPSDLLEALNNLSFKYKFEFYLVGGSVRDFLANNFSGNSQENPDWDWDLVIFNNKINFIARELADLTSSSFVELDKTNGHYRLVNKNWQADITAPRGENLETDLKKRDFTVNAVAFDFKTQEFIDFTGGIQDLKNKNLKFVSEESLKEDFLRALRAYRIACQLNLILEKSTQEQIINYLSKYNFFENIARERINTELEKLLICENSFEYLKLLLENNILESFIPEIKKLKTVPVNSHHHLRLDLHTLELINQFENIIKNQKLSENFRENFNKNKRDLYILKISCMLHDIAKPETWEIQADGKNTFRGHDKLGKEKVEKIGKTLKWSKRDIQRISRLVEYHMRPFQLAKKYEIPSDKSIYRIIRKLDEDFYLLISLAWADMLSTRGKNITQKDINFSEELLRTCEIKFQEYKKQENKSKILLHGENLERIIIQENLPRTKLIRNLLEDLLERQMLGQIKTVKQAESWFIKQAHKKIKN